MTAKQRFTLARIILPLVLALVLLAGVTAALAQPLRAATANSWTVGGVCGTTIQACINYAAAGDRVIIPSGTYTEWLWLNKPVSLLGSGADTTIVRTSDPTRPPLTIYGSTIPAAATITSTTVISGLTFTGRNNPNSTGGGGIAMQFAQSPTIQNVRVTGNLASNGGGIGILDSSVSGTFINVVIMGNVATGAFGYGGGGLFTAGANLQLINPLIVDNQDQSGHGAVEVLGGTVTILHGTLAQTTPVARAAVMARGGAVIVSNTLIASYTLGLDAAGGSIAEDYNLFYHNLTNTASTSGGLHDVSGDPVFVDPARGNYRLFPPSAALDRGVNANVAFDFDGDSRPMGAGFDIGYDEYHRPAITLTAPAANQLISATALVITGLTTPLDQIPQVDVSTDNGNAWAAAVGVPTFAYTWTVPSEDGVSHVLLARGTDRTHNLGWSAPLTRTVDRVPPQASISTPGLGQVITQHTYTVTAAASDGTGVAAVQLSTDNGVSWHVATFAAAAWSYAWPIPDEDGVSHLLAISATDLAGNRASPPASIAVFVDNVPPVITFTTIAPGQVITSNPVPIAGYSTGAITTTLDVGLGPQVVDSAGFNVPLFTPANGPYVITATATDAAGNQAAAVVSFSVQAPPQWLPCEPCTTPGNLQAAIDQARLGDTIVIPTGLTAHGPVTVPAGISLVGGSGQTWPDAIPGDGATVVGQGLGPVVTVQGASALTTTIADLTITGGSTELGGGLLITGNVTALVAGNVITGNSANENGSAVAVGPGSTVTLDGNLIAGNDSPDGSAVYAAGGSSLLAVNNLIRNNTAGAVEAAVGSQVTAYYNDLMWNYVGLVSAGTTTVTNNIVFENAGAGLARLAGRLTADYNDLAHNAPDRAGLLAGPHDQADVPLWTSTYRLISTAPQVDAGDSSVVLTHDAAGRQRPIGDQPDLGAYEYGNDLIIHQIFLPLLFRNYAAPTPGSDDYEVDNLPNQARPIAVGATAQRHNFYPAGDVDWVMFDATPGTYILTTSVLSATTDTVLRLYAANGTSQLAMNDDCTAYVRASCLTWEVVTSSTLYLQIAPYDASSIGSDRWYDVAVVKQ